MSKIIVWEKDNESIYIDESGRLYSTIDRGDPEDDNDHIFGWCVDAVESLILALYKEGVDVGTPQFSRAVETTMDAIANNL